jgi:hypothetical protein
MAASPKGRPGFGTGSLNKGACMKKSSIVLIVLIVFLLNCGIAFGQFDSLGIDPGGMGAADEAILRATMMQMKMNNQIPMHFSNAVDGKSLAGAKVEIANVGSLTTDNTGIIAFPKQPDGTYTMTVSKNGFITTPISFQVKLGLVIFDWFSISPEIPNKDFRFVLDWGEQPYDLDLHFEKVAGYHISYSNMHTADDGKAVLDHDDRSSYGPETITVEKAESKYTYNVFVIDYSNRGSSSSTALSKSGAVIRVYSQNRLLSTFNIPVTGAGTRWNAVKIVQGQIVPVNTVSN